MDVVSSCGHLTLPLDTLRLVITSTLLSFLTTSSAGRHLSRTFYAGTPDFVLGVSRFSNHLCRGT